MSATVLTAEEAKKANIELITDPEKGRQAVHDVVVALRANRRRGTASTKTKAEVNLSGAKPWRQRAPAVPRRLQVIAGLGGRRRRLRTAPARLFRRSPRRFGPSLSGRLL